MDYQETALPYLTAVDPEMADSVRSLLETYRTLGRMLDRGTLTGDNGEYFRAELLAHVSGIGHDENVRAALECDSRRKAYFVDRVRTHPGDAHAHGVLGYIYIKQRQYAPAARELEQALEIDPNMAPAHRHLVPAYLHDGRLDKALWAAKRFQSVAATRDARAQARYALQLVRAAELLRQEPGVPQHLAMCDLYAAMGDLVRAFEHARAAHEHAPTDPRPALQLARFHELIGKPGNAARILEGSRRQGHARE
jgi:tetratricopeptide (TPR) repeat protein